MKKLRVWIEAMRLRTLPVSLAGVVCGVGLAAHTGNFRWLPAIFCLLIALFAQIASNFGNEYFDYKNGLDRKGREGFRRGVTEGDISPRAMLVATLALLVAVAIIGLSLCYVTDNYWLLLPGIAILLFALAYSAGPYPLSHHGLGDIAVIIFFGLVPVSLTCYVASGGWGNPMMTWGLATAVGLLASNVLVVNNYRDVDDDRAVGKHTTVVLFGRKVMSLYYLFSGVAAAGITWPLWTLNALAPIIPAIYLLLHFALWRKLCHNSGAALNPLLGMTACNLLLFSVLTALLLALA